MTDFVVIYTSILENRIMGCHETIHLHIAGISFFLRLFFFLHSADPKE